jgi:hypothetical protein
MTIGIVAGPRTHAEVQPRSRGPLVQDATIQLLQDSKGIMSRWVKMMDLRLNRFLQAAERRSSWRYHSSDRCLSVPLGAWFKMLAAFWVMPFMLLSFPPASPHPKQVLCIVLKVE